MNVSFLCLFIILVTQVEIEWEGSGVNTSKTSHVIIRIQGHEIFGKEMRVSERMKRV
jgi:hypothetical protein